MVPVYQNGQPVGVVGMSWLDEQAFSNAECEHVTSLAARAGRVLLRDLRFGDLDWNYLVPVLGLMSDPWIPLRADDDRPAGLVIEGASPSLPLLEHHVGERLLAVYPRLAAHDLVLDKLTEIMRNGGRLNLETTGDETTPWGNGPIDLRATRVGSRLIVAWHSSL